MRTYSRILTTAAAVLFLAAPSVFSQSPQGTKPVIMTTYKVKPGFVSTFEEVIKKYRDAQEKAGRRYYMVWRGMMGNAYEFTVMMDVPGIEVFEGQSPSLRAYGERGSIDLSNRLSLCLDGTTSQMWHLHPDQSIISVQDFRFARANFVALRQGAANEENADQRKIAVALRAAGGKNLWTHHLDYGGDDDMALYITPVDKLADLDKIPTLTQTLGVEESKRISAARQQRRRSRHPYLWRYRPELSFRHIEGDGTATTAAAAPAAAALRERLLGTWRINPDKSPGSTPQISKFDRDGAFLRNTNGTIDYKFKLDGKEHAAPGNAQFDTVVWRKTGPRKYEHEVRKGGKAVYTVVTEVAADGLTRSYRHARVLEGGGTAVYDGVHDRVGGDTDPKNPIVGHWRLRYDSQWQPAGSDALRFQSGIVSYTVKLDGSDAPVASSTRIDAASLHPLSADSFEMAFKKDGQLVSKSTNQVSADGKTITTKSSRGDVVLEKVN